MIALLPLRRLVPLNHWPKIEVPGRLCSAADWLANALGGLAGVLAGHAMHHRAVHRAAHRASGTFDR